MSIPSRIPLIKVRQWLESWDKSDWCKDGSDPPKEFYVGSISISLLRRVSGVGTRTIENRRQGGVKAGYQRAHKSERSREISRYLEYGYPLSKQQGLDVDHHETLVHPGWFPTAILANVMRAGDVRFRHGKDLKVSEHRALRIVADEGGVYLELPDFYVAGNAEDAHGGLEPVEIIDGQHRLFAIDELSIPDDYELPVVFFDGMSEEQQAYLFWVVNVEPKKINTSLAFDLYPELRSQEWLEGGEGVKVYQEHRAQDLTDALWRHPDSPWFERIQLHGNRVAGHVSNVAFIRAITASFVRKWAGEGRIGGLFGSIKGGGKHYILRWNRAQQAAYLIACWTAVHEAVIRSQSDWVNSLRKDGAPVQASIYDDELSEFAENVAFSGAHSLLATDQGCRAIFVVYNSLSQLVISDIGLDGWDFNDEGEGATPAAVSAALESFKGLPEANSFLAKVADALVNGGVDWRTSGAPGLSEPQKRMQAAYRGSSGYRTLQMDCFKSLSESDDPMVSAAAHTAAQMMRRD